MKKCPFRRRDPPAAVGPRLTGWIFAHQIVSFLHLHDRFITAIDLNDSIWFFLQQRHVRGGVGAATGGGYTSKEIEKEAPFNIWCSVGKTNKNLKTNAISIHGIKYMIIFIKPAV